MDNLKTRGDASSVLLPGERPKKLGIFSTSTWVESKPCCRQDPKKSDLSKLRYSLVYPEAQTFLKRDSTFNPINMQGQTFKLTKVDLLFPIVGSGFSV